MRIWHKEKMEEIKMFRRGIDEKWMDRIVKHNLQNHRTDFVFKQLWSKYPRKRKFIDKVGYLVKIKYLSREHIGQLLKKIKEGGKKR